MNDKEQIQQWLDRGVINEKQAEIMLKDVSKNKKDESSNRLITASSTIGAILLGIGAILFVSSNWQQIPDFGKTLILLGATFFSYFGGYSFKYKKQNFPKAGSALIFLSTLLLGASIFLIAQIYHVNANNHLLVALWFVGILPLVYSFKFKSIAYLSSILFFTWLGLFAFRTLEFNFQIIYMIPILFLSGGVFLFNIGALHYAYEGMQGVARSYRLMGLKATLASLFLMTFQWFSSSFSSNAQGTAKVYVSQLTTTFLIFSIIAILLSAFNLYFNYLVKYVKTESTIGIVLIGLSLLAKYIPASSSLYTALFNIVMAGVLYQVLYIGYKRGDMKVINAGTAWLGIFILAKYFDFFYNMLSISLFLILGGIVLVSGGIYMEKKRRKVKQKLKQDG